MARFNCGYEIIESRYIDSGKYEIVLAKRPSYNDWVTWARNTHTGSNDFYWGHYFSSEASAFEDYLCRVC